jgi:Amt family ammonium transporter
VGGTFGALATGLLASKMVNPNGANGLFFGNPSLLPIEALSIVAAASYSFAVTWMILKLLQRTIGLRVSQEEESDGLDLSQHGESGYTL